MSESTEVGNYFISNYPPFSFWKGDQLPLIKQAFDAPATSNVPLGLYMHIPFCRKRCKFCYFKVYTDVNAAAVQEYVDHLAKEVCMLADKPSLQGRDFRFVYFGGGTPSFLSAKQLQELVDRLHQKINWDKAQEVTFECEPGTLQEPKVKALREIGVTRLSLGVENLNDKVLEENGRAHLSGEIYRAWEWIKSAGFAQTNIDLIAGMVGETDANWLDCVDKTIELDPDSVTIYQMELPYNTTYSKDLLVLGQDVAVAPWPTKRRWLNEAKAKFLAAGYEVSSAYTFVKKRGQGQGFQYRDHLWHGADLLGTGVASFGHLGGVHYQNVDTLEKYYPLVDAGELPLSRAYQTSADERLIREMILQLKLGKINASYFRNKFGVEILERFAQPYQELVKEGFVQIDADNIHLTDEGILRVDSLLPRFFLPEHLSSRYT